MKHALNDDEVDNFDLDIKYVAPADLIHADEKPKSTELVDSARDLIKWCVEYAQNYENDDHDEHVVIEEESSDESEGWDCETIVSTYSKLDNHPGKIGAPEVSRKKKLAESVSGVFKATNHIISLKGKEKLPLDFLPGGSKPTTEKVKGGDKLIAEQQKRKQHGQESKEEKKERKVLPLSAFILCHAHPLIRRTNIAKPVLNCNDLLRSHLFRHSYFVESCLSYYYYYHFFFCKPLL